FYLQPQMVEDLISSHSLLSHSLVAVLCTYFIYDFLDMVISCYGLAVTSCLYLGFAVVSLLVEINSVFLHLRQPWTEITAPRPSVTYSMTSWLNLGTFLVFRVCRLGWMTRWLASQSELIPRYVLIMGTAGLSVISTTNIALFYRLLRADVLRNTHDTSKNH
uniref:TLC domain-containing protein 2-like n=1 Tax=Mastacembelus armatus TaxID=205130 RepID=A0A3Q3MU60_9TELE